MIILLRESLQPEAVIKGRRISNVLNCFLIFTHVYVCYIKLWKIIAEFIECWVGRFWPQMQHLKNPKIIVKTNISIVIICTLRFPSFQIYNLNNNISSTIKIKFLPKKIIIQIKLKKGKKKSRGRKLRIKMGTFLWGIVINLRGVVWLCGRVGLHWIGECRIVGEYMEVSVTK